MKSFALDTAHDVVIENGVVQLAEGSELLRQSAETTLNTKIKEWFLNHELGIDFNAILGKKAVEDDVLKSVILQGLRQVDETFFLESFASKYDKRKRKLTVNVTAKTENGETITISNVWG